MKIKTLDIYGYGKWINQRFDFKEEMQLIFGQNEAGKSTIQSFIRSILFGFPSKHRRVSQINRFEPKHADVYGGRIYLIDTQLGNVWVERTLNGLTITNDQGEILEAGVLEQILGGLDENLFDNFYAFSVQNLQELSNIDADKLSDYFLSIGTVGSDKFLAVAKNFEKETDQLYKARGKNPPLNQLLIEYEQLANSLQHLRENMGRYDQLVAEQQDEIIAIEELNQQIKTLEEELRHLDKLIGRYDIYQKDLGAQRELERLIYTKMEPQLPEQLERAITDRDESEKRIAQMHERIANLKQEMASLTRLNWARNHEDERRKWVSGTKHIKDVHSRLEHVQERIQDQTNLMARIARDGQFYPDKVIETEDYEQEIEKGYGIQAKIDELEGQQESLKAQRKVFLDQRKELQGYSATIRQQLAKLENQRVNEEAVLEQATSLKHYFLGLIFLIIGVVLGVFYFQTQAAELYLWLALGLGSVGLLSLGYVALEHRKQHLSYQNSPALAKMSELREKEISYQERSKALGSDINSREASLRQVVDELAEQNQNQQRWLVSLGFYPTADPDLVLKTNPVKQYFEAESMRSQYEEERNDLNLEIVKWQKSIVPLLERFPHEDSDIPALINHVEETEVSMQRQVERGNAMDERVGNAESIIKQTEENISRYKQTIEEIFQKTNSFDEIDFRSKVQQNKQIESLKEKRELYAEQMIGFEEQLSFIENKQALTADYSRIQNELIQHKNKLQPHHHQRANLTVEIKQLEQDGNYQQLIQELENKKAAIEQLAKEWARKKIATELIYRTLRQGMDNPIPEMNKMANEIFSILTYGRYNQIKLNKSGIKVRQFSDVLFEPHELSQGTLEQLYVALRLAFVENASDMVQMPIIIDDAFVNFDEIRKTSMYRVLEKISHNHQVLFFTFDQHAKEVFGKEDNLIDLDIIETAQDQLFGQDENLLDKSIEVEENN